MNFFTSEVSFPIVGSEQLNSYHLISTGLKKGTSIKVETILFSPFLTIEIPEFCYRLGTYSVRAYKLNLN